MEDQASASTSSTSTTATTTASTSAGSTSNSIVASCADGQKETHQCFHGGSSVASVQTDQWSNSVSWNNSETEVVVGKVLLLWTMIVMQTTTITTMN